MKYKAILSPLLLAALASPASAIVTIDYVSVGHAGNAAKVGEERVQQFNLGATVG